MQDPSHIDQVVERVERLLLRHEELRRTNSLLAQKLAQMIKERDALKARLHAARSKVDSMLERLPSDMHADTFAAIQPDQQDES